MEVRRLAIIFAVVGLALASWGLTYYLLASRHAAPKSIEVVVEPLVTLRVEPSLLTGNQSAMTVEGGVRVPYTLLHSIEVGLLSNARLVDARICVYGEALGMVFPVRCFEAPNATLELGSLVDEVLAALRDAGVKHPTMLEFRLVASGHLEALGRRLRFNLTAASIAYDGAIVEVRRLRGYEASIPVEAPRPRGAYTYALLATAAGVGLLAVGLVAYAASHEPRLPPPDAIPAVRLDGIPVIELRDPRAVERLSTKYDAPLLHRDNQLCVVVHSVAYCAELGGT